jgi:adenosine deaminase
MIIRKNHDLDYNRFYALHLDFNEETNQLSVSVADKSAPWPRLQQALLGLINIEGIEKDQIKREGNTVTFPPLEREFTLRLGLEPIGRYSIEPNGELTRTMKRPLTVSEVRRIGTFHRAMPYALDEALAPKARTAVFTDFHTHSSGQISPHGLLEVARKHHAYYPLEWLHDAGIEVSYVRFPNEMRKEVPRVNFPPREKPGVVLSKTVEAVPVTELRPDELQRLEALMAMPTDRQSTFSEMENDAYYYRYPLTKNKELTKDIIVQMAREYARQGIKYATVSYVGLDNPELLRVVHEAMDEIANDPATKDVQLRFMVGIPRTMPLPKIEETLEKAKILLDSPYIVGIDILGYELNKTSDFEKLLDQFCDWANEHKPGAFIRAHAGENDKNLGNVKEMLRIAKRHKNLLFGIGHGVYGMDGETVELAEELSADPENPRLFFEPNSSSVIALNNVDDLRQIPFTKMVEHNIPFVVSSDSGGTYHTTAVQLGLEAMFGGLDARGFDMLIKHQQHLMDKQLEFSRHNAEAIDQWQTKNGRDRFVDGMIARLGRVPVAMVPVTTPMTLDAIRERLSKKQVMLVEANDNVPELDARKPVTVVGAGGESWSRMSAQEQYDSAIAIDMMIHALDPAKAYVEEGRFKPEGISQMLKQSRDSANDNHHAHGRGSFYNRGLLIESNFEDENMFAHYTHVERLPGKLLDLSSAIVEHTFKHNGVLVAVGGAAFTRDIITKADQRGMLDDHPTNRKMMLLLECASGASAEKSRVLSPYYRAVDGRQLVSKLLKHDPELFPAEFQAADIEKLYEASRARVDRYGLTPPAIPDAVVVDISTFPKPFKGTGRA